MEPAAGVEPAFSRVQNGRSAVSYAGLVHGAEFPPFGWWSVQPGPAFPAESDGSVLSQGVGRRRVFLQDLVGGQAFRQGDSRKVSGGSVAAPVVG